MIEFNGVSKRFGGQYRTEPVIALRDLTLHIPAGSWGIVGPNGAGKSTLLAVLLGFLNVSSGTIRIRGLEPRDYTHKHGASYLPERFRLPPSWTVRSALRALAELDGSRNATVRVQELLQRFGLADQADTKIRALSRGLLQRVGLAQALLTPRALLVFDEPTEGLDPLWRLRFRELMTELRQADRTILIASHDLAEVERLVDHVVLLDKGAVRDTFPITPPAGAARRYRIALQNSTPQVRAVFPDVEFEDEERVYIVSVRDTHELSARLAALLALGAVVEAVQPADTLEERVRSAYRPESSA